MPEISHEFLSELMWESYMYHKYKLDESEFVKQLWDSVDVPLPKEEVFKPKLSKRFK